MAVSNLNYHRDVGKGKENPHNGSAVGTGEQLQRALENLVDKSLKKTLGLRQSEIDRANHLTAA